MFHLHNDFLINLLKNFLQKYQDQYNLYQILSFILYNLKIDLIFFLYHLILILFIQILFNLYNKKQNKENHLLHKIVLFYYPYHN